MELTPIEWPMFPNRREFHENRGYLAGARRRFYRVWVARTHLWPEAIDDNAGLQYCYDLLRPGVR